MRNGRVAFQKSKKKRRKRRGIYGAVTDQRVASFQRLLITLISHY